MRVSKNSGLFGPQSVSIFSDYSNSTSQSLRAGLFESGVKIFFVRDDERYFLWSTRLIY
jgi:hypothetical protein